jgi:hypothetical protein
VLANACALLVWYCSLSAEIDRIYFGGIENMKFLPFRVYELIARPAKLFTELTEERNVIGGVLFLLLISLSNVLAVLLLYPQGTERAIFLIFFGTGFHLLMMLCVLILFTSLFHFSAEMLGNTGHIFSVFSLLCVCMSPLFLAIPLSIMTKFFNLPIFLFLLPIIICIKVWVIVLSIMAVKVNYGTRIAEAIVIFFVPFLVIGALSFSIVVGGTIFLTSFIHSYLNQLFL